MVTTVNLQSVMPAFSRTVAQWRRLSEMAALIILLALLVLMPFKAIAAEQLTARVDRNQMTIDQTFTLTVATNQQVAFSKPDFSVLEKQFTIVSNSQSNQYRSINGQVESLTQWRLTLAPKQVGRQTIPSITLGDLHSDPVEISVTETPTSDSAPDQPIQLEITTDKTGVFVQEQLLVTFKLLTSVNLVNLQAEEFTVENAVVKQVAENSYQTRINGKTYGVVEVSYAVFPQTSGLLTIPDQAWLVTKESDQYDPYFGRSPFGNQEKVRVRAKGKSLQVKAQPDNYPAPDWLPGAGLTLEQDWSKAPDQFVVGEPITRTITLKATGLTAAQLAPLQLADTPSLKFYSNQPQTQDLTSPSGIVGKRVESYAIVPTQSGQFTLPAVEVQWWDTVNQQLQTTRLPEQAIVVAPSANQPATYPSPHPLPENSPIADSPTLPQSTLQQSGYPWLTWVSLALNILLMAALIWLARQRSARRSSGASASSTPIVRKADTEKLAYTLLLDSLKGDDPALVRQQLLLWAQAWFHTPQLTLQELTTLAPVMREPVKALEASLYAAGGQSNWGGDTLRQAVDQVRQLPRQPQQTADQLPPLNP